MTTILLIALGISIILNIITLTKINSLKSNFPEIDNGCCLEGEPERRVSYEMAIKQIAANPDNQVNEVNEETKSVFVPWDDFRRYLNFVKNGMAGAKKDISGLEFYFAANTEKNNSKTLVVFPTYLDETYSGDNDHGHIPYDFISEMTVVELYSTWGQSGNPNGLSSAYNRMGQAPPRMPSTLPQ